MLPGSGKTVINSALAYSAKDRRIARFAGLVAGPSIGAIIAATGRKTALSVSPPSGRRSGGANQEELARVQAGNFTPPPRPPGSGALSR